GAGSPTGAGAGFHLEGGADARRRGGLCRAAPCFGARSTGTAAMAGALDDVGVHRLDSVGHGEVRRARGKPGSRADAGGTERSGGGGGAGPLRTASASDRLWLGAVTGGTARRGVALPDLARGRPGNQLRGYLAPAGRSVSGARSSVGGARLSTARRP